ncbi:MAG TPA: chorismate synthase [bacterium]|nr:chorismate synthase [bacterium]
MNRLRFMTGGESHGQALTAILEGMPAGLPLSEQDINRDLLRRQRGYGRGERMQIEKDQVAIKSGIRYGKTLGSPISLLITNRDWPNWQNKMALEMPEQPVAKLRMPRPGHADFAGMVKYRQDDLRNILERSSARETTMRVAVGAIARKLLGSFGVEVFGHVLQIGSERTLFSGLATLSGPAYHDPAALQSWREAMARVEESPVACADEEAADRMMSVIDQAKAKGDTLGGVLELVAIRVPVGLGSHVHYDRKLDAAIAQALMSINAIKAVSLGAGYENAFGYGSQVHDQLYYQPQTGYYRSSNNAGGIEGGMSNGEAIIVRAAMKPLPTLVSSLHSVDVETHEARMAHSERSDVCAVPAAVVVGEAMLCLVLADALYEKLGGDSLDELQHRFAGLAREPLDW